MASNIIKPNPVMSTTDDGRERIKSKTIRRRIGCSSHINIPGSKFIFTMSNSDVLAFDGPTEDIADSVSFEE